MNINVIALARVFVISTASDGAGNFSAFYTLRIKCAERSETTKGGAL
jgi:hypothetical protein